MKKIIILIVTILTLQGCQVILPTKVETLNLVFSPNISEETFLEHKNEFLTQLKAELLNNGYDVSQINVILGVLRCVFNQFIELNHRWMMSQL